MTEEDRTELLQAARNITSAMSQSTALASLGSGAEALAVIRNSVLPPGNHAVRTWGERPIARLCDGVERLSSDNRQELLDLVGQLHWIFRVRSIESLCGRLSHLNEAQRHMVKEMVVGLEDSPQKAQLLSKLGHGINAMKPPSA